MLTTLRLSVMTAAAAFTVGGCASPAARARVDTAPVPTRGGRVAALDSATARRVCAAPDAVLAGRAPCVLRNQAPPPRVF